MSFAKVRCEQCRNEQAIFLRAKTVVRCLVCNEVLAQPRGGTAKLSEKAAPVEAFS